MVSQWFLCRMGPRFLIIKNDKRRQFLSNAIEENRGKYCVSWGRGDRNRRGRTVKFLVRDISYGSKQQRSSLIRAGEPRRTRNSSARKSYTEAMSLVPEEFDAFAKVFADDLFSGRLFDMTRLQDLCERIASVQWSETLT